MQIKEMEDMLILVEKNSMELMKDKVKTTEEIIERIHIVEHILSARERLCKLKQSEDNRNYEMQKIGQSL